MKSDDDQIKNVAAYRAGGDDMCDTFIQVVDLEIEAGTEVISLSDLRVLLVNYKATARELEEGTINNIVGLDDETVKH